MTNIQSAFGQLCGVAAMALIAPLLAGCSTVTFQQLSPDLRAQVRTPVGAVYYLPKPYLLVAQLPTPAAASSADDGAVPDTPPTKKPTKKGGAGRNSQWPDTYSQGGAEAKGDSGDDGSTSGSTGGSSDQSFGGASQGYMMKLVYLPDMSRPMSMSVRAGFGTATLKPTLQNGWMLTGFDASADSKTADILKSVADVLTAYKTPGAAKGGGAAGGGATPPSVQANRDRSILRPGLYEFRYDAAGQLIGLCPISFFDENGTRSPIGVCAR